MIVKREKYYIKYINKTKYSVGKQQRKRTSFWLLGIIPLYIKDEVINGDYEW
jgi:hypothetical protein